MKIAVDAYPLLSPYSTGIPNYVRNIVERLVRMDADNKYLLYSLNPASFPAMDNAELRSGARASKASYMNTLWLFTQGVRDMRRERARLFIGTRQMLPPLMPGIGKLLVVYDLVWHYHPGTMSRYHLMVARVLAKGSMRAADHIITISKDSARAMTEVVGIPPEKISVVYPAADQYTTMDKDESAGHIASRYGASPRYALTVNTVEPRKNLPTLLRVFAGLKGSGLQLLIAGASGWKSSPIYGLYEELGLTEREVKFLGYIPAEDMNALYSGAEVFLYPSLYEGFGIPPLEAMRAGTPVIVSGRGALPEVAGDAGMILEPMDTEGWRKGIERISSDQALKDLMRAKGLAHSAKFTWEGSAQQAVEVVRRFA